MTNSSSPLDALTFDNRFTRELPADQEPDNYRRQVYGACFSRVKPTPAPAPKLAAFSSEMAEELGLSEDACRSEDFIAVFAGNRLTDDMDAYATCYGGHQFGQWAGQLGDGRAINLGDVINRHGRRWTLQLKGAGLTPYSRSADGLAVLRSSLREFLCSEAMHHLGVPTTRALSLILTGKQVVRDMFYSGDPQLEPGAVVCRVAPSFTRFGHFQIFTSRDDIAVLKQLVDYTIRTDFPQLGEPSIAVYLQWFEEVCRRTARMIVHWQRVGFVHGVMNTDNMSILGLTIDYGPYGWLEDYDPDWTPNTTDAGGRRYRFGRQPQIAYWNLVQLANALYPLIKKADLLQQALTAYTDTFDNGWNAMMAGKLGLERFESADDPALIADLLTLLPKAETDMTIFFRLLANLNKRQTLTHADITALLGDAYYDPVQLHDAYLTELGDWLQRYQRRLQQDATDDRQRRSAMNAVNPKYVLRNYLAQLAIDQAEQHDFTLLHQLLDVLRKPYDEQPDHQQLAGKRPDWARHRAGCSMLSCSS